MRKDRFLAPRQLRDQYNIDVNIASLLIYKYKDRTHLIKGSTINIDFLLRLYNFKQKIHLDTQYLYYSLLNFYSKPWHLAKALAKITGKNPQSINTFLSDTIWRDLPDSLTRVNGYPSRVCIYKAMNKLLKTKRK